MRANDRAPIPGSVPGGKTYTISVAACHARYVVIYHVERYYHNSEYFMITDRILIRLRPAIILVRLDEGPITVQVLTPVTTDKPKHGTRDTAKIKKPN